MPDKETFALINASINGLTTMLLVAALVLIRRRRYAAHGWAMLLAVLCGAAFLATYLTSKFVHGEMSSGMPAGWYRFAYIYLVLLPHTVLAIVALPLILLTVSLAAGRRWPWHRTFARWAYPVWLYVSATGVLIYFMLYVWYPRLYPEAFRASPLFS